jgi:hypothetical protein
MRALPLFAAAFILASGIAQATEKAAPRRAEPESTIEADDGGLGPLFHASTGAVRERLGDPDVSRAEGKGAFWTYRLPNCALFVFFHESSRGLRVTGASTGPRKRGEPPMTVQQCLATAVQFGSPN